MIDPVWFFITDWFAVYLVSKGFRLEETLVGCWVPFLAADRYSFQPVLVAAGAVPLVATAVVCLLVRGPDPVSEAARARPSTS